MSPPSPTEILRDQHRNILQVADVLERVVDLGPGPRSMDFDAVAECIDFVRLYADALHHGKEEDLLFPELESLGIPSDEGPIAVMLAEHRQGREYVRAMALALETARTGDEVATRRLAHAARGYVALIRAHIMKEDHVLFDMADQMIPEPACRSLCAAYDGVCQRHFEGNTVAQLEVILARLLERYPRA